MTGATWSSTTCPDNTNSNNDGDTCVNELVYVTSTGVGSDPAGVSSDGTTDTGSGDVIGSVD